MTATPAGRLAQIVGPAHVSTDPDVLAGRSVDHTGRYRGRATALVRPDDTAEVAAVLRTCRDAGSHVTVQGGRTSLVAGTVPEHDDVLLSTERLTDIGPVDTVERRVWAGAGVTLAALQHTAAAAGLTFGVDLAARDTATVGGMAATNAGGLRTVRYGNMGEQVLGLEVALPDGSVLRRHSAVRRDNTGYEALIAAGRARRDTPGMAALEPIDARIARLAAEHLGVAVPAPGDWLLLVELTSLGDADDDQTERLAVALDQLDLAGEPAVGVDSAARQRLWRVRESTAEVLGVHGPPVKFDVSLPPAAIPRFAAEAAAIVGRHAAQAIPVLFGHIGEGNLHLNVLRCTPDEERALYPAMMDLIAGCGGNVSSEHGVGTRKRDYLGMSR